MAASPYWYIVEYDSNIDRALQKLREKEFRAGRYYPAVILPQYPVRDDSPTPGPQHASIEQARDAAMEEGTQSILDLDHVSATPEACAISPLNEEALQELYGTTKPNRDIVEFDHGWYDYVERGQGIFIILYRDDQPSEIFMGGYSFD